MTERKRQVMRREEEKTAEAMNLASITTPTPFASMISNTAVAICCVSLS
jgi:hypothetical protein